MNHDEAAAVLASLRYEADQLIVTPFGERAWLKKAELIDKDGVTRSYLTECCYQDPPYAPCERHAPAK
jgi:hypothetical protein